MAPNTSKMRTKRGTPIQYIGWVRDRWNGMTYPSGTSSFTFAIEDHIPKKMRRPLESVMEPSR